MAIKLTNVEGRKLVPEYPEQSTQDFVMINHPVFFVDNPVKYAQTLAIFHSGLGFGLEAVGQALSLSKLCSKDEPGGGILPLCDTAKLALARVWIAVDPSGCEASSRGLRRRTATRVGQCGADERGRMTRRASVHVYPREAQEKLPPVGYLFDAATRSGVAAAGAILWRASSSRVLAWLGA